MALYDASFTLHLWNRDVRFKQQSRRLIDDVPDSEKMNSVLGVRNLQSLPVAIFCCTKNPGSKSVGASTVQKGKNARKVDDINAYAKN
jgi:hypothetical protein